MVAKLPGVFHNAEKAELAPGAHVYVWRLGYSYSHHGIVVHTAPCEPNCRHEALACCAIVHFRRLATGQGSRIELASLSDFAQGAGLHQCRYGVPQAEFFLKRAGSCSTHAADLWPLVVLRALSIVDVAAAPLASAKGGAFSSQSIDEPIEAQVEYCMLRKNCELLARWCKLGTVSGVRRFRSTEFAFSPQSAPGRLVRLGLVTAVPAAATAAVFTVGNAPALPAEAMAAGSLVASAAVRQVLLEMVRHPQRTASAVTAMAEALPTRRNCDGDSATNRPWAIERGRRPLGQDEGLTVALCLCLDDLGVRVPGSLAPLLQDPWGCVRLCEVLVDALEASSAANAFEIAAIVQSLLDALLE